MEPAGGIRIYISVNFIRDIPIPASINPPNSSGVNIKIYHIIKLGHFHWKEYVAKMEYNRHLKNLVYNKSERRRSVKVTGM